MKTDIFNPVVTVKIRGDSVEVRELTWKHYLRAVKELTDNLLGLMSGKNTLELNKEKVVATISAQEELVSWVIQASTGKDAAWVDSLSARELLLLLKAVVDLNLSEELIGVGKGLAGRMADVFGLKTASLAPSTT